MIHPTAIVDPGAKLGAGVEIGPYAVVEAGVELGAGTRLANHAVVRRGSVLGEGVRVDSFAVVGGEPQDLHFDAKTDSGVRIGAHTVLREGVTVHRATKPGQVTTVGEHCLLMAQSHVAHDCAVGNRVVIANGALVAGHVRVGDFTFISGNVVIHQFVRVGEGVMTSGGSRISMDVAPYTLAAERNALAGLNLVGLKRRGFGLDVVSELKRLFHFVLTQSGNPKKLAAEALAAGWATSEPGLKFLAFFEEDSRRKGYLRWVPGIGSGD